jgi:hypothetical protein
VELPGQLPTKHTVGLKIEGGPFEPVAIPTPVIPTPTPFLTPAGDVYHAEDAALSGGLHLDSGHDGYLGKGFVSGFYQGFGQSATFTVKAKAAGTRRAVFRYTNAMGSPQFLSLTVNGSPAGRLEFPPLSSWSEWAELAFEVELKPGANTIAVVKNFGDGCVNLDYLVLP